MFSEEDIRRMINEYKSNILSLGKDTVWRIVEQEASPTQRIYLRKIYAVALEELIEEYDGWHFDHGQLDEDDDEE